MVLWTDRATCKIHLDPVSCACWWRGQSKLHLPHAFLVFFVCRKVAQQTNCLPPLRPTIILLSLQALHCLCCLGCFKWKMLDVKKETENISSRRSFVGFANSSYYSCLLYRGWHPFCVRVCKRDAFLSFIKWEQPIKSGEGHSLKYLVWKSNM